MPIAPPGCPPLNCWHRSATSSLSDLSTRSCCCLRSSWNSSFCRGKDICLEEIMSLWTSRNATGSHRPASTVQTRVWFRWLCSAGKEVQYLYTPDMQSELRAYDTGAFTKILPCDHHPNILDQYDSSGLPVESNLALSLCIPREYRLASRPNRPVT